jgi:hypothetical protein
MMAGYREHSFDPRGDYEGPARPFSWIQWTGVGFFFIGLAAFLTYCAGRFGWIPKLLDSPLPTTTFMLFGVVLINSRRAPLTPPTKRRRVIVIAIAAALCAIGAALVILDFKGA